MQNLLEILAEIPDPEIPVINIVELGIVREVIIKLFRERGVTAKVISKISPIWTTDWMTDAAREKLRAYGITPPERGADKDHLDIPKKCPRCGSANTTQISRFGSTLCKASYQCNDCLEPFDYFKCH